MKGWKRFMATGLVASVALLGAACEDDGGTTEDPVVDDTGTAPADDTGTEPADDTLSPTEGET